MILVNLINELEAEMSERERDYLLLPLPITLVIILCFSALTRVDCECIKKPVIFNFGDYNSDTGGFFDGLGINFGPPNRRIFYHHHYHHYHHHGANFAISGSSALPRHLPFSLDVQVLQFLRFQARLIFEGFTHSQFVLS